MGMSGQCHPVHLVRPGDGFESCCVVSSHHLVNTKRGQLERANLRRAASALGLHRELDHWHG